MLILPPDTQPAVQHCSIGQKHDAVVTTLPKQDAKVLLKRETLCVWGVGGGGGGGWGDVGEAS